MRRAALLLVASLLAMTPMAVRAQVVIKLGTVAPEGSSWHDLLLRLKQDWKRLSNSQVELRIYAGGVLGDETEMVRKMQRRGLDAVAMSGSGLSRIDPSFDCLGIPLAFSSYGELDVVRDAIAPRLERNVQAAGFRVLHWSDTGWVYFFTKTPARTPDDVRKLKVWIPAGDPNSEALYKELGFKVVPLPLTDMMTSLQTGLIEAIEVPPLYALLDRSYQQAGNMLDLRLAALPAATVILESSWSKIPEAMRPALLEAARKAGEEYKDEIRASGDDAIAQMKQRGLKVVPLDVEAATAWDREIRGAYPKLRGRLGPPDLFDEVLKLRDDHRKSVKATTPAPGLPPKTP